MRKLKLYQAFFPCARVSEIEGNICCMFLLNSFLWQILFIKGLLFYLSSEFIKEYYFFHGEHWCSLFDIIVSFKIKDFLCHTFTWWYLLARGEGNSVANQYCKHCRCSLNRSPLSLLYFRGQQHGDDGGCGEGGLLPKD